MLRKRKTVLLVLCALGIILWCVAPMFATKHEVEITGVIYAFEWDANGNVAAVIIETEEGEAIGVSSSGRGAELLKLEEVIVRATGTIAVDENGNKTFTVSDYVVQQ